MDRRGIIVARVAGRIRHGPGDCCPQRDYARQSLQTSPGD